MKASKESLEKIGTPLIEKVVQEGVESFLSMVMEEETGATLRMN